MTKRHKSKALAVLHETMGDLNRAGAISDAQMRAYDEACLASPTAPVAAGPAYRVYKDSKGAWRWRLLDPNGAVIASSGESYKPRSACLSAIENLKKLVGAPVAA